MRYLAVGAAAAGVYYGLFAIGWLAGEGAIPYLGIALVANLLTAALTYPLYRRLVWRAPRQGLRGFLRFYAVGLWALCFILVGLPLLVEVLDMPVLLAQAILLVASPLINYQLLRFWTFRQRRSALPD